MGSDQARPKGFIMDDDVDPPQNDQQVEEKVVSITPQKTKMKTCLACGKEGVKSRCGGCRQVYFCDIECQRRVWISHRPVCCLPTNTTNQKDEEQQEEQEQSDQSRTNNDAVDKEEQLKCSQKKKKQKKKKTEQLQDEKIHLKEKHVTILTPPSTMKHDDEEENNNRQQHLKHQAVDSPTASKNSKNKKKKKKKRSNSFHAQASSSMISNAQKNRSASFSVKKHVHWGEVKAREFTRFPGGGSAVPYDGTWALGLGDPIGDIVLGDVNEVEEIKAKELKDRIKELPLNKRKHVRDGETRQFDYCRGIDNPLFKRMSEVQRKKIFVEDEKTHPEAHHHPQTIQPQDSSQKQQRKSRHSKSNNDEMEVNVHDFACVSVEQLDEFMKIRDSREECGCSCGDLVRKVSKMNIKKLHTFLAERDVAITSHSKSELMTLAKAIALEEKNCSNSRSCECVKNGIECHANVCIGCAGECFNPNKWYGYDKDRVKAYRKTQLAKWQQEHLSHVRANQNSVRVV